MDTSHLPSFSCELSIIRARNIEYSTAGTLFVRFYLQSSQKFRLTNQEIPATRDPEWNQTMILEWGSSGGATELQQQVIVFELRRRKPRTILGRIKGSELMGRVEIPWKQVFDSPGMYLEDWFPVSKKNSTLTDSKPPAIRVRLEVLVPQPAKETSRRRGKSHRNFQSRNWISVDVEMVAAIAEMRRLMVLTPFPEIFGREFFINSL